MCGNGTKEDMMLVNRRMDAFGVGMDVIKIRTKLKTSPVN